MKTIIRHLHANQRGVSLVELLVTIVLIGLVFAISFQIVGYMNNSNAEIARKESLLREMRFAMDEIRSEWIKESFHNLTCNNCILQWEAGNHKILFAIDTRGLYQQDQTNQINMLAPHATTGTSMSIIKNQLTVNIVLKNQTTMCSQKTVFARTDWMNSTLTSSD